VAKTIFARKNYFCHHGFFHGKNVSFFTNWQKPANTGSEMLAKTESFFLTHMYTVPELGGTHRNF